MLAFLSRRRNRIVGGGVVLLACFLLLSSRENPRLFGRPLGLLGAPAQGFVQNVTGGVAEAVSHYVVLAGARREADDLRREVADLRRELLAVDEVALENRRLKTLLSFKESTAHPLLPAQVTGRSASVWFRNVVLDKGAADGVRVDCPVVTAQGLVGRVYQVSDSACRVILLTDTSSGVDALIQRTRSPVVVEGRLSPSCRILYLARADEAAVGDRVVTSGLDGVFPKGLFLGQVAAVQRNEGGIFQAAELKPGVDFFRLEEVFVVLPAPENGT